MRMCAAVRRQLPLLFWRWNPVTDCWIRTSVRMKLRTRINDPGRMIALSRVVQAVSKQSKSVVVRMTPDRILLTGDETTSHKYKYWCTLSTGNIFTASYELEGVPGTTDLQIETNAIALSKSLKLTNSNSKSLSIRLSKFSNQPVLNITIEEPGLNTLKCREVSHNIPIFIMSRRLWHEFDRTEMPVQVSFQMGNMNDFAVVARKMKLLDKRLVVGLTTTQRRSNTGVMRNVRSMSVSTAISSCAITSQFQNIRVLQTDNLSDEPLSDPNNVRIAVETKLVHQFLNAFKRRGARLTIGIMEDKYMTLHMTEDDFTMDYVIPACN